MLDHSELSFSFAASVRDRYSDMATAISGCDGFVSASQALLNLNVSREISSSSRSNPILPTIHIHNVVLYLCYICVFYTDVPGPRLLMINEGRSLCYSVESYGI